MSTREFDDIIKQKAQRRQADVPPDIWENIYNKKKKRRTPFLWFIFLMLLIGSSVAVWKIKTGNNDKAVVAPEKINNNKINKGNSIPVSDSNNNHASVLNNSKDNAGNTATIDANAQAIAALNTNNSTAAEKRNTFLPLSIKQQAINNGIKNEKIFLQRPHKKNTKGKYKATIQNGEAGESAGSDNLINLIKEKETETASFQKKSNTDSFAANNSLTEPLIAPTIDQNKMNTVAGTVPDSIDTTKTTAAVKENVDKKGGVTKAAAKQKNAGLKIEAGITIAFPVQQYKEPQTVQRLLSKGNTSSSFTSNKKIRTSIEGGSGIAISLIKNLNHKWSIGGGISYMRFTELLQLAGNETNTVYSIVQRLKEGPNGAYLKPDTISTSTSYSTTLYGRNIYQNAGIPLFARYHFITGKKLSCAFTTGFILNLVRKYKNNIPGEFTVINTDGSKQSGMKNSVGLDVFAGLLLNGRLYRKYEWFAAAEYTFNLSAYKTSSLSFNKKIHLPGVSFGVLYEWRK